LVERVGRLTTVSPDYHQERTLNVATSPLLTEQVVAPVHRVGLEPIHLALHQRLMATVEDVVESKVVLNLGNGQRLLATTRIPLAAGDRITLEVQRLDPRQITFRLAPAAPTPAETTPSPASEWVPDLLASLGIADDELNRAIALELIQQGLTVEPDLVSEVRSAWVSVAPVLTSDSAAGDEQIAGTQAPEAGQQSPAWGTGPAGTADGTAPTWMGSLPQIVQLVSHHLPVNVETIALAATWSDTVPPWGEHITALLSALVQALTVESEAHPHMTTMRPLLTQLLVRVAAWSVQGDRSTAAIAEQVQHVLQQLGTSVERQLLSEAFQLPPAATEETASSSSWVGNMPPSLAAMALKIVERSGIALTRETLLQPGITKFDQILLYQVGDIAKQLADSPELTRYQRDAWQRVNRQIEQVLHDLRGGHLFNLREPSDNAANQYYAFPLPLASPEGPRSGQVQVFWRDDTGSGKGVSRRVDPEDVRLLFRLDLHALGPLELDLVILQKRVRAHIRSDSEDVRLLARQHADELREALRRLDYSVEQCRTSVLTRSAQSGSGRGDPEHDPRPVFRIDTVA
jgi:hypothetical protein